MSRFRTVVCPDDVETHVCCWGKIQWLSEPRVTGAPSMITGVMTLNPGRHQAMHNHPGISKNLYVLEGKGELTLDNNGQGTEVHALHKGYLAHLQPGQHHALGNPFDAPLELLVVYEFSGPETSFRSQPGCSLLPPSAG